MPQKLIRLTSETDNGVFNGLFDQDIEIKKDSEVALQTLTLERSSDSFNVNSSNETIEFVSKDRVGSGLQSAKIDNKTYEQADAAELMTSIQTNMNASCDMITDPVQMNVQWQANIDQDDDVAVIQCRPSPFFPLINYNVRTSAPIQNNESVLDVPVTKGIVTGAETPTMGPAGFGRLTETATGALAECYMFNNYRFIKSTGSFRIKLSAISEQAGVLRPAFTIALVEKAGYEKLRAGTITETDLTYAIQVDAKTGAGSPTTGGYSYISELGSGATTPTNPFVKIVKASNDGNERLNDVLEIVIKNGVLQGFIHQNGVASTTLPASTATFTNTALFPVVFCHLANTTGPVVNNLIDMIQCSFDPWQLPLEWYDFLDNNPQLEPKVSTLPEVVQYDGVQTAVSFDPDFGFATAPIAEYLGYTNRDLTTGPVGFKVGLGADLVIPPDTSLLDPNQNLTYTREQGYTLRGINVFASAVDSESYLVETQSFTLDSYDSYGLSINERTANSGGSRRNILATVPVSETAIPNSANVRVVYEPSTLNYIAIKNRSDIITRQIRMRLLDSRYNQVSVAGLAAMTILIREPE